MVAKGELIKDDSVLGFLFHSSKMRRADFLLKGLLGCSIRAKALMARGLVGFSRMMFIIASDIVSECDFDHWFSAMTKESVWWIVLFGSSTGEVACIATVTWFHSPGGIPSCSGMPLKTRESARERVFSNISLNMESSCGVATFPEVSSSIINPRLPRQAKPRGYDALTNSGIL